MTTFSINLLKNNNFKTLQQHQQIYKKKKLQRIKSRILGFKKAVGKCNSGVITVKHKGGGHKQRYRNIDFKRKNLCESVIINIEYDPNRNANIAAAFDAANNNFFYVLAPGGLSVGDVIKSGKKLEAKLGYSMPLQEIPTGSSIYNIPSATKIGVFTKAAGTESVLIEKSNKLAKIQLNSGKITQVPIKYYASVGRVSNEFQILFKKKYKAGNSRWLGIRPTVRGVAMNPIDHPNGGGEGKKSSFKRTPWGKKPKSRK